MPLSKKNINFTPKLPFLFFLGGGRNLQFLIFLPYRCYIPYLAMKIDPVVFNDVNRQRTTDDEGPTSIATE